MSEKTNMLELISNLSKIIPGELGSKYEEAFNKFLSTTEIKTLLKELKEEGYIMGSSRMGYRNAPRFECTCSICKCTFKSRNVQSDLCYDCNRDQQVPIENKTIPTLKEQSFLREAFNSRIERERELKERRDQITK